MGHTERGSYWGPCTQFNLKSFADQRAIAEQRGWKVDGQLEKCGTTDREHYQFYVKTPQVRESEVRKVFAAAHIERARNVDAVKTYCHKDETRIGALPQASQLYPNQDKLLDLFVQWIRGQSLQCKEWLYDNDGYPKKVRGELWLQKFDDFINDIIPSGYRVESLAVNPAIRSIVKNYMNAIYSRHVKEQNVRTMEEYSRAEDRQTDRQVEIFSQHGCTNNNGRNAIQNTTQSEGGNSTPVATSEDHEDSTCRSDEGSSQSASDDDSEEGYQSSQ